MKYIKNKMVKIMKDPAMASENITIAFFLLRA
jgi:hypothetical protein